MREAFAELLRHHGFDVATAVDGADALRQLHDGVRPCLVLLDLRMPEIDGWQVWREIKRNPWLAKIPVVVVTGDLERQQQARDAGVAEALLKPIKPDALLALAERHCRRAR